VLLIHSGFLDSPFCGAWPTENSPSPSKSDSPSSWRTTFKKLANFVSEKIKKFGSQKPVNFFRQSDSKKFSDGNAYSYFFNMRDKVFVPKTICDSDGTGIPVLIAANCAKDFARNLKYEFSINGEIASALMNEIAENDTPNPEDLADKRLTCLLEHIYAQFPETMEPPKKADLLGKITQTMIHNSYTVMNQLATQAIITNFGIPSPRSPTSTMENSGKIVITEKTIQTKIDFQATYQQELLEDGKTILPIDFPITATGSIVFNFTQDGQLCVDTTMQLAR